MINNFQTLVEFSVEDISKEEEEEEENFVNILTLFSNKLTHVDLYVYEIHLLTHLNGK